MFKSIVTKQSERIKVQEFADHPVGIGSDPENDGYIMAYFAHVLSVAPGNNYRYDQSREYHRYTQWPPHHTPANIF